MYVQPPVNTVAVILLDEVANTILPSGQSFARIRVIRNDLLVPPGACKNTIPPLFLSIMEQKQFYTSCWSVSKGTLRSTYMFIVTLVIIYSLWYTLANLSLSTVCGCGRQMEEASVSNSAYSIFCYIIMSLSYAPVGCLTCFETYTYSKIEFFITFLSTTVADMQLFSKHATRS